MFFAKYIEVCWWRQNGFLRATSSRAKIGVQQIIDRERCYLLFDPTKGRVVYDLTKVAPVENLSSSAISLTESDLGSLLIAEVGFKLDLCSVSF